MSPSEISAMRLRAQLVSGPGLKTPEAVVDHMGVMQAQDYDMSKGIPAMQCLKYEENFVHSCLFFF